MLACCDLLRHLRGDAVRARFACVYAFIHSCTLFYTGMRACTTPRHASCMHDTETNLRAIARGCGPKKHKSACNDKDLREHGAAGADEGADDKEQIVAQHQPLRT